MAVKIYFAGKDTTQENFVYDEKYRITFCFFFKEEIKQMKTFSLYAYIKDNDDLRVVELGLIYLFFKGDTDYDYLLPDKYQNYEDFNIETRVYSIGGMTTYYKFLERKGRGYVKFLNRLGDIIFSKVNLDKFKEVYKIEEISSYKISDISIFLLELSNLIFNSDNEVNYITLSESKTLYKNNQFANDYKELYNKFFDKIYSTNLANDFLDFIQKHIYEGKGKYANFRDIILKIEEKYTNESTKKKLLKLDEPVNQAYEKIESIKIFLKVNENFLQDNDIHLGHYTSISTLRILLENQKNNLTSQKMRTDDNINNEDLTSQNRVGYLRLTNSRLMNDPLEGKVITTFLDSSYNQKDFLPSHIYMMSLTPNGDTLPMWKQYGDNGEGAFIRLKNIFLEKIVSDSQADIYRVCYLSTDGEVHVSNMSNRREDILKTMLEDLKERCENLKEIRKDKYPEIISNIQQDISFLFKTVDYSYEEEYRIVLSNPDNLEIKCETKKDYPFPFLYVYLSDIDYDSSKYSAVIIGPKAIEIDFIGPYINYLDPEIDISLSKIPYR